MTATDDPVFSTREEGVAEIVLNRPARRNAVTGPLAQRLHEEIVAATEDDEVAVLLIRGAGGAFCSGLDLGEFRADPPPDWMPAFSDLWLDVHAALYDCPKPIVAALERFAINAGSALALAADLLVAGEQAFLHVGEIQMGMAAPMNMAWLRLRHPESVAARLAVVGRRYTGRELERMSVAAEVVADDAVLDCARELSATIAGYPPRGVRAIKRTILGGRPAASGRDWFAQFRAG
ncbi:MAG: enoyl-CoA hydratase/isomerase family protein [Holophagales bacterium]|nr:enoyl-CoA hydratase/isomerase family protein [Holophagales bacterium]MYG31665.1 enoyl-CoA hydratase/isomerase family protein [Holophagales bacterium]MYI79507.1 enoyl-CoA hydratase/isomerase family protein [Holophagales bacterium]